MRKKWFSRTLSSKTFGKKTDKHFAQIKNPYELLALYFMSEMLLERGAGETFSLEKVSPA